ncbi:MAG: hypothetical protein DCF22_05765 [Leptolyngbya sp.]|nr:MAG: hypothetical protein DCF22_05765 [Leptolyngbya sp.]
MRLPTLITFDNHSPRSMKNSCSLLLSRTLPLSAVLLFFEPTIASAQTQPTPTDITTTTPSSPVTTPVTTAAVGNPPAIAAPVQSVAAPTQVPVYLPVGSPQYARVNSRWW